MKTNYKQAKNEVLKCYEELLNTVHNTKILQENDSSLVALSEQAKKIEEDKFCLIVAGEAKSGKSTFINAYLGNDILPMGVLQCTSSIVEIRYGKEFVLTASYADGKKAIIKGETKIKAFLEENAALDNDYRDIPVTLINNEIIRKYKDKKIPKEIIEDLLKVAARENIHKLPKHIYDKKINDYIKEKQHVWGSLVIKIEITYPFDDVNMRGIRIIDSPGVNAVGRVGDMTASYIETADAIMFLRPITGQAIEANSFKDFLETKSVDRNKNAIFLILTRAASETQSTIDEAHQEFVKIFGAQKKEIRRGIVKEQIIPVDSKAELYFNFFTKLTTEEIKAKIKELNAEQKADNFLRLAWLDADCKKEPFLIELKRLSNFSELEQALNIFGRKAYYIALSEFLNRMETVYEKIISSLTDNIEDWLLKQENPNLLAIKLQEKTNQLTILENKMNEVADDISEKYQASNGEIKKAADKVIARYKKEADEISGDSEQSLDQLEKLSFRQIDKFHSFQDELKEKVINECNQRLIDTIDKNVLNFTIIKPDLTREAIHEIRLELKSNKELSYEMQEVEEGFSFWKTKKNKPFFSQQKYYKAVKTNIVMRLEKIETKVISELRNYVTKVLTKYKEELATNIVKYKEEKNKIQEAKKNADEIEQTVREIKELLFKAQTELDVVKQLKGGIDGNL